MTDDWTWGDNPDHDPDTADTADLGGDDHSGYDDLNATPYGLDAPGYDGLEGHDGLGSDGLGGVGLGSDRLGSDGLGDDGLGDDAAGHDGPGHEGFGDGSEGGDTPGGDTGDAFGADALVAEHHDWSDALDTDADDGDTDGPDDAPPADDPDPGADAVTPTDDPVGAGLVGADPDADGAWPVPEFPATLDLGAPPEPVDGFPWTDPSTLGDASLADPSAVDVLPPAGSPEASEIAAYAGLDSDTPWDALTASDDPATAALARFWSPPTLS